jgi:hypothetical protein
MGARINLCLCGDGLAPTEGMPHRLAQFLLINRRALCLPTESMAPISRFPARLRSGPTAPRLLTATKKKPRLATGAFAIERIGARRRYRLGRPDRRRYGRTAREPTSSTNDPTAVTATGSFNAGHDTAGDHAVTESGRGPRQGARDQAG